jgi:hypothetical protein
MTGFTEKLISAAVRPYTTVDFWVNMAQNSQKIPKPEAFFVRMQIKREKCVPTVVRYLLAGCPWLSLRCESPGVTFGECCPFDAAARTAATWPAATRARRARQPTRLRSLSGARIPLCAYQGDIIIYILTRRFARIAIFRAALQRSARCFSLQLPSSLYLWRRLMQNPMQHFLACKFAWQNMFCTFCIPEVDKHG